MYGYHNQIPLWVVGNHVIAGLLHASQKSRVASGGINSSQRALIISNERSRRYLAYVIGSFK